MKSLSYIFAFIALLFFSVSPGYAAFPIQSQNTGIDTLIGENLLAGTANSKELSYSPRSSRSERHYREGSAGFGIAALALGITGLFVAGLICGICAIVFGVIGMKRRLKGLAIAGFTLGIIDTVVLLLYLATL